MARSISADLRKRVVAAVEGGMSRRAAAAHFQVGASSAIRWVAQTRVTGEVAAKPQGGDRRSRAIEAQADRILALIATKPDSTLEELKAALVSFSNRRLELTRAGSRFFVFAERILEEYAQVEEEISGIARQNAKQLRIVSLHGPSIHLLPPVVSAFHVEHPDAVVSVYARGVGESLAALVW